MTPVPAREARRRITEATFLLVEQAGIEGASQRRVAEASGLNVGSVRHHFPTQEALMVAAAEEVGDRMARRLTERPPPPADAPPSVVAQHLATIGAALVPEGVDGRRDMIVLQELFAAARRTPTYRPLAQRMGRDLRTVLRDALGPLHFDPADLDLEVEHLVALIAGLTHELLTPHGRPDNIDSAAIIARHVRRVADRATTKAHGSVTGSVTTVAMPGGATG